MNKVITINLGGIAYQLEEAGYDVLRLYLESAAARLQGNPDRDEILSDIERAIGEKFGTRLNGSKNVIVAKEVDDVIDEMGPVDDGTPAGDAEPGAADDPTPPPAASAAAGGESAGPTPPRRLYCLHDGAMLSGVCNGLGAYFGIDPTFVRLGFIVLTLCWGMGVVVYIVMALVVPSARSAEEKAAAFGAPATAREFVRRAREGYYDAFRAFPDRHARREWKRKFKQDMREWRHSFRRDAAMHRAEWRQRWYGDAAVAPGMVAALPLFSILHGALAVLWLAAMVSLLSTGAVFGVPLPGTMPVWAGALILLLLYSFVSWPLKAMRRAFYHGRCTTVGWGWPFVLVADSLVWLAVMAVMLWLAYRFWPQAHDALRHLPATFHAAANDIRDWWHSW